MTSTFYIPNVSAPTGEVLTSTSGDPAYVMGLNFSTTNVDTSTAITSPVQNVMTVNPATTSQSITFGAMWQSVFVGPANITSGGHFLGSMGWGINNSNATAIMGIGVEGRFDHGTAGTPTTTRGHGVLGLVVNQAGTMSQAYGVRTEIQNAATIPLAYGFQTNITVNSGTFTKFVGYGMPLMTGVVTTPTQMLFFENLETAAPGISKSPIVTQSYVLVNGPTTGFSYTIPANIDDVELNPAGTLATGTVVFPLNTATLDGFVFTVGTTQTITALTLGGNGASIQNAPTTLAAGTVIRYKFYQANNTWVKR